MITEVSEKELMLQREYIAKIKEINSKLPEIPLAHVHSFGCQQNVSDGEKIKGMLALMGYGFTRETENADLILFNTCAVRENAEDRVFGNVGALKKLKEKNRNLIIAVGGCMVQQEHIAAKMRKSFPQVDIIFGTHVMHNLPQMIYEKLADRKRTLSIPECDGVIAEGLPINRESKVKASVPIMYGCNNFCTYCIVPYVRGRERSRKKEDILKEVKELADAGYKEITLLGQNVNSYGKDLDEEYDFADLLTDICKIEGDFIVRFMTSHPKDATHKLIDTMAREPKIAKHFHLPLQAGNDRVLKKMNRHYDKARYLSLVDYMREKMPDIGLTTDIIVGFPTETEEEFEDTLDVLSRVGFDNIYSFIYSARKGTPAYSMEGHIPYEVQSARFTRMLELQSEISVNRNRDYEGKPTRVLVEGRSKTDESKLTGRNEKNRLVHFEGPDSLIGQFANVMITKAETYALFGELMEG